MFMRKKYIIALLILFITTSFLLAIGATYAVWTTTNVQEKENVINVGCFKITFKDTGFTGAGDINLSNDYPVSDEKGALKTPYKFSIKNECSIAANYAVQLETLVGSDMDTSYLKVKLDDATPTIYKSGFTTVSSESYGLGANTIEAKQLLTGLLTSGEEKVYELRVWIDYSAEVTTPSVMGSTWLGKIVILSEATSYTEEGIPYSGEGTLFTNFLSENHPLAYYGPAASNYVRFNDELWRVVKSENNVGTTLVRANPIEGYTFDYDNLNDYTTSPFIRTVNDGINNGVENYYDTLSADAKAMIIDNQFAVGELSSNTGSVSDVHSNITQDTKTLKVYTPTVTNFIYSNSDVICNDYNFATDIGTNKCVNSSYMIGAEYVYSATKGANNLFIISRGGIKELTTESNVKILPSVVVSNTVLVNGGSGLINDPYILSLPVNDN